MSAHTPGPWHAHGKTVSTHADNAKGWKAVAVTWRAENAQLIAAAPDLLAACERRIQEWHNDGRNFGRAEPISLQEMRAAIARVRA